MNCRLCNNPIQQRKNQTPSISSEDLKITAHSQQAVDLIGCTKCGLTQATGIIDQNLLNEQYSLVQDPAYELELLGRKQAFARDLNKLSGNLVKNPKVLEIGAFTGIGADAVYTSLDPSLYLGIEPSVWACQAAQQKGMNVIQGEIGMPLDEYTNFDLVCAWDVIEHLEHPDSLFTWLNSYCQAGSLLFLTTPDWNSTWRKLFGSRWWFIEPMHRCYFTLKTLEQLANQNGWQIITRWEHQKYLSSQYILFRASKQLNLPLLQSVMAFLPNFITHIGFGQMSVVFKRI